MGLKLTLQSPVGYIRAVSGLFITKKYPSGLTPREIDIVAKLMEHSSAGTVTFAARKKTMTELEMKPQNFYNAMVILKEKGVMIEQELHRTFTTNAITIKYAGNS